MSDGDSTIKHPPDKPISSVQYDLFTQFVAKDSSGISNTVELWESIPKYFITAKQMEKLRSDGGQANPFTWQYEYEGVGCAIKIQPASIEQKDGTYKSFFPGVSEEFIEEALKKIFSDQQQGIHDPKNAESWVKFTLSMLQKELKKRGRTRSLAEIKQSIEILSSSVVTLYQHKKEVWKGTILQDLVTVGRDEYLADTDSQHVARLPLFLSLSINRLAFRQYNYSRYMECSGQLARWIYKQMINHYKNPSISDPYEFQFCELSRDSGLLQQGTADRNRQKVISGLKELEQQNVLKAYESVPQKKGNRIVDVNYRLFPSSDFIREQEVSQKRENELLNTKVIGLTVE